MLADVVSQFQKPHNLFVWLIYYVYRYSIINSIGNSWLAGNSWLVDNKFVLFSLFKLKNIFWNKDVFGKFLWDRCFLIRENQVFFRKQLSLMLLLTPIIQFLNYKLLCSSTKLNINVVFKKWKYLERHLTISSLIVFDCLWK